MRRREAIFALGGAAAWPLRVRAQQKVPRIGVLRWEGASVAERLEPFRRRLRELGYIEGQNVIVEYRYAEGRTDRAAQLAAEFVQDKVDIIVAISTPVVVAAKNATQSIPIVMVAADALGTGLVASLSRPGGNVTGVSLMQPELAGKRLEVLKHIVPALSRLAFLGSTRDPAAQQFNAEARAGAERLGIRFKSVLVRGPEAFEEAFAEMDREQTQAVIVQPTFVLDRVLRARVVELASKHRLPMISDPPEFARAGGLVSYGVDSLEFYGRTAAGLVDRILKGAAPGELPIEQPTVFILVINLGTAKALGVEIPPTLLARADEVIE